MTAPNSFFLKSGLIITIFSHLLLNWFALKPVIVGSTSSVSSQGMVTFPSSDTNNLAQGFTFFNQGFTLQDKRTTCTYNGYYPVTTAVTLNGGGLYLQQDLVLSNTCDFAATGGRVYGNNYAVIFPHTSASYLLPAQLNSLNVQLNAIDSIAMFAPVRGLDWSGDSRYIVSCSDISSTNNELKIYYFDGNLLTTTQSIEINRTTYTVSWNKKYPYVALGLITNPQSQMRVFRINFSNGTSIVTDVREFGGKRCYAVDWHPTGTYLMAGKEAGSNAELETYSLDTVTGLLTNISIGDLSPNRDVGFNGISFSPSGNYVAVGTVANTSAGGNEGQIHAFNSLSNDLPVVAFINPNITMQAVSWNPVYQNYVAFGYLNSGTDRIRLYQVNVGAGTLTDILSSHVPETNNVTCLDWHPSGQFLIVGIDNGLSSRVDLYYFDTTALTLTKMQTIATTSAVNIIRWSPDGSYVAWGENGNTVRVYGLSITPLLFDNTIIVLNSPTIITGNIFLNNSCTIRGNGNQLSFGSQGALLVRKNSNVCFEDVIISGVQDNKIICLDDSGSIVFENCSIDMNAQYTYSRGSLLFSGINELSGGAAFIFSSRGTMSIDSWSTLLVNDNVVFQYAPVRARRDLISLADRTSQIYFDQASLVATSTGLRLSTGTLLFDNSVTLSSQGRNNAEGIVLDRSLALEVLGNAQLELCGFIVS